MPLSVSSKGFGELCGELARVDELAVPLLSKERLEIWSSLIGEDKGNFEIARGTRNCGTLSMVVFSLEDMIECVELPAQVGEPYKHGTRNLLA